MSQKDDLLEVINTEHLKGLEMVTSACHTRQEGRTPDCKRAPTER